VADDARAFAEWNAERALAIVEALKSLPGAALPVLHALQAEFGYIHANAIPIVADALNLSRAEIVGVVNFYHDFRQEPAPGHQVEVCRAEACQAMGCESLVAHIQESLGVIVGGTTDDGEFGLKAVYCLGNCALSPALMFDGRLFGRVTPERFEVIVAGARS
jgi:formate dehydrogenase subunit gamma